VVRAQQSAPTPLFYRHDISLLQGKFREKSAGKISSTKKSFEKVSFIGKSPPEKYYILEKSQRKVSRITG
jgi:hypothetical protein